MNPLQRAIDNSTDGTGRLDVEYARTRLNGLASQLELILGEAIRLKTDIGKLLDELDTQQPADKTEPGL